MLSLHEVQILLYDLLVASKSFQDAKERFTVLKAEVTRKKELVRQLQDRNKPLHDFKELVLMFQFLALVSDFLRSDLQRAQQEFDAKRGKTKKAIISLMKGLRELREENDKLVRQYVFFI